MTAGPVGELRAYLRLKPFVVFAHDLSIEQKNMLVLVLNQVWGKAIAMYSIVTFIRAKDQPAIQGE